MLPTYCRRRFNSIIYIAILLGKYQHILQSKITKLSILLLPSPSERWLGYFHFNIPNGYVSYIGSQPFWVGRASLAFGRHYYWHNGWRRIIILKQRPTIKEQQTRQGINRHPLSNLFPQVHWLDRLANIMQEEDDIMNIISCNLLQSIAIYCNLLHLMHPLQYNAICAKEDIIIILYIPGDPAPVLILH